MIIDAGFLRQWSTKGHDYGTCMSRPDSDLMYVNIPKNASSWTKPNLQDWGWEFYNYHTDQLSKTAIVALRDPVERWCSGIAEYIALYHPDMTYPLSSTFDIFFDRVCFDDHTDRQINFIHGLDMDRCIFLKCDKNYSKNFSTLLAEHGMPNRYFSYEHQHVSESSPIRRQYKFVFDREIKRNPRYLQQVQDYFARDYELIESVEFYGTR
jgi:hypothetical protein